MNTLTKHLLATADYRFTKAIQHSDSGFALFRLSPDSHTPLEIVHHMVNLLSFAESALTETDRIQWKTESWNEGVDQFHTVLSNVSEFLDDNYVEEEMLQLMIQGPFTDLLSHIGQLAMLARVYGKPIERENYLRSSVPPVKAPKRAFVSSN
ncbi:MAG: hypothetical protein EP332_14195 [Bacteroidetes bacterium]|nr:MAG: hypothetical protein EP332_14195 [Bacteroidota bacterium]